MPYTNQMTIVQWLQNLTNDSLGITQSIVTAYATLRQVRQQANIRAYARLVNSQWTYTHQK